MRRRSLLGAAASGGIAGLAGCLFAAPDTAAVPDADGGDGDGGDGSTTTEGGDETTTTTSGEETTTTDGDSTTTDGDTTTETTTTETTQTTTAESTPRESVTVTVGEGGTQYAPQEFTLAAGGTVEWVWEGNGHNVIPTEQPDGADWEGTAGPDSKTYDAPHEYSRTFETPGEYAYKCFIHGNFGMVGSFTVE